jgi:perosamine synthetase
LHERNPKSFATPREQFLTWQFVTARSTPSPQTGHQAGAGGLFFFWARNALFHALRALAIAPSARVLMPAYICKAAVEPFEAYGMHIDFYNIRRDCTPDFAEIESKIHPDTRVVLAVHYFGFPQRIQEFRNLCDTRNLLLFEDCAHLLRGAIDDQPLGSFGDVSVFSYRKFLPMFDGAELLLRDPKNELRPDSNLEHSRFSSQATRHIVGQALESSAGTAAKLVSAGINLAKRVRSGPRSPSQAPAVPIAVDNNSASFDSAVVNQPMSSPSRWVLRHADVTKVINRRRENFQFLHEQLADISGITPLVRALGEGVCPWIYPLIFDDVPNAHLQLRAAGIPAVTWGGVRPQSISRSEFPDADFMYDNLFFLPIHQNLSRNQLRAMADTVKRVRRETLQPTPERVPVAS